CRVCGNKASGLHFGVNTCEACNEFFRRSLKRGANYHCSRNLSCKVWGKKRSPCSSCRYRRCLEVGMSRNRIKTGRYSHRTRAEYAQEIERNKQHESYEQEREKVLSMLETLVEGHDRYIRNSTHIPEEDIVRVQEKFLSTFNIGKKRRRTLRKKAASKNQSKDPASGREYPGSTNDNSDHDVKPERWLRSFITYAKLVPGFKHLPITDQASLVRNSWFEFWFLGAYRGFNSDLKVVTYPIGHCLHMSQVRSIFGEAYCSVTFHLAKRMKTLRLSAQEMVLMKTVCLLSPDRCELVDRDAVEKIYWAMVSALLHVLKKNRPQDRMAFPRVVGKIVELR
ncbi:hypothetical protein EGW08_014321, partial [Elysia chlorotica]